MEQPLIIYLHGFTSGPQSAKARALGTRMAARGLGARFVCPQLPAEPADAIALAESLAARNYSGGGTALPAGDAITVVGSSLGGFYATVLAERHGWRAVLINPSVLPAMTISRYLGPQQWLYTGESFVVTPAHIAQLRAMQLPAITRPERYWLFAEEGDETLDYRDAVRFSAGARQDVLPGGDHSFTRWPDYLDAVIAFAGFA